MSASFIEINKMKKIIASSCNSLNEMAIKGSINTTNISFTENDQVNKTLYEYIGHKEKLKHHNQTDYWKLSIERLLKLSKLFR